MSDPRKKTAATPEELADEAKRARKVRQLVDISTHLIMQSNPTRDDAEALVERIRRQILLLFPDGEETYEIVYAPRFRRIIDEFTRSGSGHPGGVVIPFRAPTR